MTGANQSRTQILHSYFNLQNVLPPHEQELYELAQISGIVVEPQVFRILLDLLKMDVSPSAVFSMLQNMSGHTSKPTGHIKKSQQIKGANAQTSGKKKPPIAAKPKKANGTESH